LLFLQVWQRKFHPKIFHAKVENHLVHSW
jgi:hypothetical protein